MVREVAEWHADRIEVVLDWPLRDLFLARIAGLQAEARRAYETSLLVWAATAPHYRETPKPPEVPAILRGIFRG